MVGITERGEYENTWSNNENFIFRETKIRMLLTYFPKQCKAEEMKYIYTAERKQPVKLKFDIQQKYT